MTITNESPEALIWQSITSLDDWLDDYGWAGFDPYDLKGAKVYVGLIQQGADASLPTRVVRKGLVEADKRYPLLTRRLLGIDKQINAKAMGLFARGYLDLFQATGDEKFRGKAVFCLNWLEENHAPGYAGFCWGYPFDWQSAEFIPEGTPSSVVSSVVGDAFWRAYEVLGDDEYLEICNGICQFFLQDLKVDEMEDGSACFSYTPIDDFHVHNANLFVAEFLTRVGSKLKNSEYLEWGQRAAGYALREQNPDGSLYYWGAVQNHHSPDHIDHYHSGFEIRSLYKLWKWSADTEYLQAVRKYYRFYRENLVINKNGFTVPKMTPDDLYPIDIHSCAEALLCSATLAEDFEEARILLPRLSAWVLNNMQSKGGWFIYRIKEGALGPRRVRIPYIRWGQAWMLNALSAYYLYLSGK